jgi:hypothetical protein
MAIDFPSSPTNGQVYANYIYDSSITAWRNVNTDTGIGTLNAMGLKNVAPTSVAVGSGSATVNANGVVTFNGVSSVSLNGVFTGTYDSYKIILKCQGSSLGAAVYLRIRSSGTDRTNPNHYYGGYGARESSATVPWYGNGATSFDISRTIINNPLGTVATMEISNPYLSTSGTSITWQSWANDNSGGFGFSASGLYSLLNSNDGITLYTSTGTFDGKIQVYGLTN